MQPGARVAVVTGGSRGIGRAIALRLAGDGCCVVVAYERDLAAAAATVAAIEAGGGRAIALQADVADAAAVVALFDDTEAAYGGVDVVAHSAGRLEVAPVARLELASFDSLHRTNVRGTMVVNQQAARRLRDGGAIVNLSSSIVDLASPGYAAYAMSKGAVDALTLILARELRGRDVTVNAVAPGPVETTLYLRDKTQEQVDRAADAPPLGRLGTPDDVAELVSFLAGPAGRWVNGQVIKANGGLV